MAARVRKRMSLVGEADPRAPPAPANAAPHGGGNTPPARGGGRGDEGDSGDAGEGAGGRSRRRRRQRGFTTAGLAAVAPMHEDMSQSAAAASRVALYSSALVAVAAILTFIYLEVAGA